MFRAGILLCVVLTWVSPAPGDVLTNPADAPSVLVYACSPAGSIEVNTSTPYQYLSVSGNSCTVTDTNTANHQFAITGCPLDSEVIVILSKNDKVLNDGSIAMYKLMCNSGAKEKLPDTAFTAKVSYDVNIGFKDASKEEHELVGVSMSIYKQPGQQPPQNIIIGDSLFVEIKAPTGPVYGINTCEARGSTSENHIKLLGQGAGPNLMTPRFSKGNCSSPATNKTCFTSTLKAFRFKNDNHIKIECEVTICKSQVSQTCDLPSTNTRRRRELINVQTTKVQAVMEVYDPSDLIITNSGFINHHLSWMITGLIIMTFTIYW